MKNAQPAPLADATPPLAAISLATSYRLIPSQYSVHEDSVLTGIAPTQSLLATAFDLDSATNDRLLAEQDLLPGIGAQELVAAVPYASIVNAAFTHTNPLGSRFNSPHRGAWYAGFSPKTAQAEVAFHKTTHLAEIGRFEDDVTYDEYLAAFHASFHDLRADARFAPYLAPDSYVESQGLAERLLEAGSYGVVYPSVRHRQGACLACFRPALVSHVRKGRTIHFRWHGSPKPTVTVDNRPVE